MGSAQLVCMAARADAFNHLVLAQMHAISICIVAFCAVCVQEQFSTCGCLFYVTLSYTLSTHMFLEIILVISYPVLLQYSQQRGLRNFFLISKKPR